MLQEVDKQIQNPYQVTALVVAMFALAAVALRLLGNGWVSIIVMLGLSGGVVALVVGELMQHQPEGWREVVTFIVAIRHPSIRDVAVSVLAFIGSVLITLALATVKSLFAPATDTASHEVTNGGEPTQMALLIVFVSVVVVGPLLEEIIFRGVLQRFLANHISVVAAIGGVSLLFALLHIPAYGGLGTPLQVLFWPLLVVFTDSLIYGVVYHATGNVVTSWIAHGASNLLATSVWLL